MGGYVLMARVRPAGKTSKMMSTWTVLWRMSKSTSLHVYHIQDIIIGKVIQPFSCVCFEWRCQSRFSGAWEREIYLSLRPNTCIVASRNFLNISPTLFLSLSPHYDTSRVPIYDRLHLSHNRKPPNVTLPFNSSDLTQAKKTRKLNKPIDHWLPVALSTPPPFERGGGGDVWARETKERDTVFWRG